MIRSCYIVQAKRWSHIWRGKLAFVRVLLGKDLSGSGCWECLPADSPQEAGPQSHNCKGWHSATNRTLKSRKAGRLEVPQTAVLWGPGQKMQLRYVWTSDQQKQRDNKGIFLSHWVCGNCYTAIENEYYKLSCLTNALSTCWGSVGTKAQEMLWNETI